MRIEGRWTGLWCRLTDWALRGRVLDAPLLAARQWPHLSGGDVLQGGSCTGAKKGRGRGKRGGGRKEGRGQR